MNILIFGATGLLGSSLIPFLSKNGCKVFSAGRSVDNDFIIDITDCTEIIRVLKIINPEVVINLVAATNVNECETNIKMAVQSNVLIPSVISTAISNSGNDAIHLIHISTDQVYDGIGNHIEDLVCPVNVYGLTKLTGELMLKNRNVTVLRTNFFGKSKNKSRLSFSDWAYQALLNRDLISVYEDVWFTPLHINTLCSYIHKTCTNKIPGTFNLGVVNSISKAEFVFRFAKLTGLDSSFVKSVHLKEKNKIVVRPLNMSMNVRKFESTYKLICPDIESQMDICAREYLND